MIKKLSIFGIQAIFCEDIKTNSQFNISKNWSYLVMLLA